MKARLLGGIILGSVLLIVLGVNLAYAQWSAIMRSGYSVTTNWHGQDVPFGQAVTAWAGTTNPDITEVQFKWKDPNKDLIWNVTVEVSDPYTTPDVPDGVPQEIADWAQDNHGYTIWYASNTKTPDILGDWGVQILFHDSGKVKGKDSTIVAIRATSGNVVPEAPLGTIAIVLAMFAAVSFIAIRNRKIPLPF